ncbi:MAG: hypothetical protein LAN71_04110 [Acidobacteriia bacterium]|nr:hypothetical protein [Terriglobia bacterium]
MSSKRQLVPVSERAIVQRLNRAMGKEGLRLKKARSTQTETSVGEWYVIDITRNFVAQQDVDLAKLAKKWKVLAAWETVGDL